MSSSDAEPVTVSVDDAVHVSGLLQAPPRARACYVLAHGAGAGMTHPFMAAVAKELAQRHIATLRYQFPYAAVAAASRLRPDLPLVAGGKSFGGRMTSQAQAAAPLPGPAPRKPFPRVVSRPLAAPNHGRRGPAGEPGGGCPLTNSDSFRKHR